MRFKIKFKTKVKIKPKPVFGKKNLKKIQNEKNSRTNARGNMGK